MRRIVQLRTRSASHGRAISPRADATGEEIAWSCDAARTLLGERCRLQPPMERTSSSPSGVAIETGACNRRRLADVGQATSPAPVVRGRDAELASIGVQLDRVRSGAGAVVLVEGAPGMGKTR